MHLSPTIYSPRKNGKRSHIRTGAEKLKPKKPAPPVITGTIKSFDRWKGIGWIAPDTGGRPIFFEVNVSARSQFIPGQKVQYNFEQDREDCGKWVVVNLQAISG